MFLEDIAVSHKIFNGFYRNLREETNGELLAKIMNCKG